MRERTVAFYEVVADRSGQQVRLGQLDFIAALEALGFAPVEDRRWEAESVYIGNTFAVDDEDHLLLHRVKDAGEWMARMDLQTGDWHELESKASEGYLETTAISFLGFGNVIGMMQGSTSSPSHKAFEGWLNALSIFKGETLVVRPLMSRAEVERLRSASGISRVEIRIGSSKASALAEREGRLATFLKKASVDYGDVRFTVTITVPRGKARNEDRAKLLADLNDLAEVMPTAAEVAKARLVYADAEGFESSRLAEFVEHHITAKRRVPAVDEEGNSIRLSAALRTITEAALGHEEELRLAADVLDEDLRQADVQEE